MNRKRRKAAKMFRRRYGKATNSFWKAQTRSMTPDEHARFDRIMSAMWNACKRQPSCT